MARDYGRIRVTIWQDHDFTSLSIHAQQLYFYLITQSKLDMAGITNWRPRMAMKSAQGWTEEAMKGALDELEGGLYVLLDEETDELLVRSFIRNDEIMRSPNLAKAMQKAWRGMDSDILRGVVSFEVNRLIKEDPSLKGSEHCPEVLAEPFIDPSGNPFGKGSGKGSGKGCGTTTATSSSLTTTSSSAADADSSPEFDAFWSAFPPERKANKTGCKKKFAQAVKSGIDPEHIIQAAEKYRDDPNREEAFTVAPHRWLNEERWDAGPLPPRNGTTTPDQRRADNVRRISQHQPWTPEQTPASQWGEEGVRALGR